MDTRNISETPFDTRNTHYKIQNTTIHYTRKFQNFTTPVQSKTNSGRNQAEPNMKCMKNELVREVERLKTPLYPY